MTSINAGGAFYRVQNSLNQNSENVSKSMQRLASGQQNIAPGDRTASSAVAWGMKSEAASLKIGMQNGTEAMQAVEMLNNDIQAMNSIVVRLEELYALSTNEFNTTTDKAALEAEADTHFTELARIANDAKWKGNQLNNGTGKTLALGELVVAWLSKLLILLYRQVKPGHDSSCTGCKGYCKRAHATAHR
jgi:flagellin